MAGVPTPRRTMSARVSVEMAEWVDEISDTRMVGRALVIDRALRLLREAIERAPDLVDLPPPPPRPPVAVPPRLAE